MSWCLSQSWSIVDLVIVGKLNGNQNVLYNSMMTLWWSYGFSYRIGHIHRGNSGNLLLSSGWMLILEVIWVRSLSFCLLFAFNLHWVGQWRQVVRPLILKNSSYFLKKDVDLISDSSFLLEGRQWTLETVVTAQAVEFLPLVWRAWLEFLAPVIGLAQVQLLGAYG